MRGGVKEDSDMNTKTIIRLVVLLAIGAVVYYFVMGGVQKDMDKNQQNMQKAIEDRNKDIPTNP